MSVVRYPWFLRNYHISILGHRKHFQYVCYLSNSTTKLKRISETNNTPRDIARIIYRIYVWTPGKRKRRAGALLWIDRFSPYRATKIRCSVSWPHKDSLPVLTLDTKNTSPPYSSAWCPRSIYKYFLNQKNNQYLTKKCNWIFKLIF